MCPLENPPIDPSAAVPDDLGKCEAEEGLVSVIMPVYNAEKTLAESAGSVLRQTYEHLELILVDDGSKDNSQEICRRLARQDARVKIICQKNAGPAAARNAGMAQMRGEFVLFADSDDHLEPDACQQMIRAIGDQELVIAHYYFDWGAAHSDRGLLSGDRSLSEEEFLSALVRRPGSFYFSALWNKLYRASIIRRLALQFDSFLYWGEDFAFNMQYYHAVSRGVALVSAPLYHYVKNAGSTSIRSLIHVVHGCRIKYRLYRHLKALYVEKGLYPVYRRLIHRYIWNVTLAD